jgi:hypothetical protein
MIVSPVARPLLGLHAEVIARPSPGHRSFTARCLALRGWLGCLALLGWLSSMSLNGSLQDYRESQVVDAPFSPRWVDYVWFQLTA